jgi:hypothetical protein
MATSNFFALLDDEENDDPQALLAKAAAAAPAEKAPAPAAVTKKAAPKAEAGMQSIAFCRFDTLIRFVQYCIISMHGDGGKG